MEPRTDEWTEQEDWLFRCNRRVNYACVGLFVLGVIGLVLLLTPVRPPWPPAWIADIALLLVSGAGIERTHRLWLRRSRRLARDAEAGGLARLAPLAEAMNMDEYPNHPEWRRDIAGTLVLLLSRVGPEDASRIDPQTWRRLGRFLSLAYTPEQEALQAAILEAAGAAGSESLLPAVKTLARVRAVQPGERRIREAAARCLSRLKARLRQQTEQSTLLRPTSPAAPARLLRPAESAGSRDDRLLRPHDGRS